MPKYRLLYFNARARAEIARLLFVFAGIDYEDVRYTLYIDDPEEWAKIKPTIRFGRVPVLEVDGKPLSQSLAITNYLAREFGLSGKDIWEEGRTYEVFFTAQEILEKSFALTFLSIDSSKMPELKNYYAEKRSKHFETDLPRLFSVLETLLEDRDYFVESGLTVGDLNVFLVTDEVLMSEKREGKLADFMDNYPKILAHRNRIAAIPSIAAYLASRPVTLY
ncbi:hematopoietic prostaglandin D synthase-like [Tubulanus polymorphus]|uniref:hematopoietic prostaglandin D synthase-like n=1 Tax=Tubulanus polymorphus TaxID=672921 RepID=UPI003DA22C3E